ncbi:uncharacterized protein si:ch211-13c6.2 isoform X1 [Silurus meridionalis]|uniref:Uncharacterized protein n=2 Tax=Silurus meridionalis TaxID=175797 RepID=A0A8T0AG38_SILME|nr:uncharacterized protein si:ch211-13c6.2 isoform X1 [Silurus meridionalis]XP_046691167.1 uncharacterized protein si:ch211-13c6.2 isoform X1 [Silurus meridionalis]XP_046691168.1 uncharacterized protein si:ch211-13c6.2 isoform X1 [Silurus meridionalis]KAF7691225.1 hypothetical protein HF521_011522 [Silurus meridionalis]
MADLLTVYDDGESNTFIDCMICDKRIRGDTNYKIHVTTLQHLKREQALADKGLVPRPTPLPQWTSIREYLTYLNLNEPIIGLGDLVQEEDSFSSDGKAVLQYRCRLCAVQMDLFDMTTHVVGRRHRQKYLERHRKELVTWEKTSEKQAGVVARAKAAIVEKQEGWGNPVPLVRSERGRLQRNRGAEQERPPLLRGNVSSGRGGDEHSFYNRSHMKEDEYRGLSHYPEDNQYNKSFRDEVSPHPSSSGDNRYDAPYSKDDRQQTSYREIDYMERPNWKEKMKAGSFSDDGSCNRQSLDKGDPQPYQEKWYPETNSSRGAYKSGDDDYYEENISQSRFGESGIESWKQDSVRMQEPTYTTLHGSGPGVDKRQWQGRNLPYTEQGRDRFQDMDEPGHGSSEMQDYNKRPSYYPSEDATPAKKQRKSRFSDGSTLEMNFAQKSQFDSVASKYQQKGRAAPTSSQAFGNTESTAAPKMENVLDILNGIQIENVQEANFLKEKLCDLLKEFQLNKAQRSRTSTEYSDGYHGGNEMESRRDMQEPRHLDDQGFQEPARYDRDFQGPRDYSHTRHVEEKPKSMRQNRGPDEPEYQWDSYRTGSAGRSDDRMSRHPDDRRGYRGLESAWNSRPLREEERFYPGEHRYQHDYRSGGDLYDPFEPSSSPPLETGSSTLDKLASTLLELVARKAN